MGLFGGPPKRAFGPNALPGMKSARGGADPKKGVWGEDPIYDPRDFLTLRAMKTHGRKKTLTLGEFIERVYDVCDKGKAGGIVRIAPRAHLVKIHH